MQGSSAEGDDPDQVIAGTCCRQARLRLPAFLVFLADFFLAAFLVVFFTAFFFTAFFFTVFVGTFLPSARASDRPMAIACLRLVTFLPEPPLFNVPALAFFTARATFFAADFEYFAMGLSDPDRDQSRPRIMVPHRAVRHL
jgi:hypothetical protein